MRWFVTASAGRGEAASTWRSPPSRGADPARVEAARSRSTCRPVAGGRIADQAPAAKASRQMKACRSGHRRYAAPSRSSRDQIVSRGAGLRARICDSTSSRSRRAARPVTIRVAVRRAFLRSARAIPGLGGGHRRRCHRPSPHPVIHCRGDGRWRRSTSPSDDRRCQGREVAGEGTRVAGRTHQFGGRRRRLYRIGGSGSAVRSTRCSATTRNFQIKPPQKSRGMSRIHPGNS